MEVAEEVKKMHPVDLINFLVLFMKDHGQKEINILKNSWNKQCSC